MKNIFIILLLFLTFSGLSQRKFIYGFVKDSSTQEKLIGAHVQNLTSHKLTIVDEFGEFRMPVQLGDTLRISSVGYQVLGWIAEDSWFSENFVEFLLPIDTIYLQEVVIGEFPEYSRFKQIIVDTQPKDTQFWYHGVAQPVMKEFNVLEKKALNNPIYMATHPISFLHNSFSKKAKEQRKMQQINKRKNIVNQARSKFTREWVAEVTQLEGDELTEFIAYCNFTPEYIAETYLYFIHERMMALLDDFLEEKDKG